MSGLFRTGIGQRLGVVDHPRDPAGDNWIVNGQKVWTSFAQFSTRCVLLTRTAPGHDGITAFFVDLDAPGITIRPLRTMHGVDEFCEVYYDDVMIPSSRMLGRPGDGWRLAMDLLPYERSTCFWQRIAYLYARFDELIKETSATSDGHDEFELGAAYLGLHTLRCRSRITQHRLRDGARLGWIPLLTRCCWPALSNGYTTQSATCCPGRSSSKTHLGAPSTCTRARRQSMEVPPRFSETSSRAGCSTSGRSEPWSPKHCRCWAIRCAPR